MENLPLEHRKPPIQTSSLKEADMVDKTGRHTNCQPSMIWISSKIVWASPTQLGHLLAFTFPLLGAGF